MSAMCLETAGWLMRSSRAAPENERSRTYAANARNRASSLITPDYTKTANYVFPYCGALGVASNGSNGGRYGAQKLGFASGAYGCDREHGSWSTGLADQADPNNRAGFRRQQHRHHCACRSGSAVGSTRSIDRGGEPNRRPKGDWWCLRPEIGGPRT